LNWRSRLTWWARYNQDFGEYNPATGAKALTAPQISGLTGTTLGAACVSAIFAGTVGTRYGRKIGLTLAAMLYVIGLIINCAAKSYAVVIVGKVVLGLAVGLAANFVIAYWAETSPVKMRGLITVLYGAITNLAQFVGACIVKGTNELTTSWAWRGSLMTEFIPPLILLIFIYWIPETPSTSESSTSARSSSA
jgi:MFS family permease